jgi:hypothetical protein
MIGSTYMILCKPAFVFDGRNILNGPALEKSVCVSKYRFLGSQSSTRRGPKHKKGFIDYIRKLRTTITYKRYTVDDGD